MDTFIRLRIGNGLKQLLQATVKAAGLSMSEFIRQAIIEKLKTMGVHYE